MKRIGLFLSAVLFVVLSPVFAGAQEGVTKVFGTSPYSATLMKEARTKAFEWLSTVATKCGDHWYFGYTQKEMHHKNPVQYIREMIFMPTPFDFCQGRDGNFQLAWDSNKVEVDKLNGIEFSASWMIPVKASRVWSSQDQKVFGTVETKAGEWSKWKAGNDNLNKEYWFLVAEATKTNGTWTFEPGSGLRQENITHLTCEQIPTGEMTSERKQTNSALSVVSSSGDSPDLIGNPDSLAGTTWSVTPDHGSKSRYAKKYPLIYEITFSSNGTFKFSDNTIRNKGQISEGEWRQRGEEITLDFNNKHSTWVGKIADDNMNGTGSNTEGNTWTWEGKKVK